jgi:hypothetical protein
MNDKNNFEDAVGKFVKETESPQEEAKQTKETKKPTPQEKFAQEARDIAASRLTLQEEKALHNEEVKAQQRAIGMGFMEIPLKDLPSSGIFYPEGTKIHVRSASGGDIRHWSMVDETSLLAIDDALNYIIERCVTISYPNNDRTASWKDLVEIDRFYLVLAVRDFTFTEGKNELKVAVSEVEDVVVKKDNITFIDLPEGIYKFYDTAKRCFVFPGAEGSTNKINIFMPTVGTSQWLRNYVEKKNAMQERYDESFVQIAPMLINDWRQLNDKSYADFVNDSMSWSTYDWSLISKVKRTLQDAVTPKLIYVDENGAEKEAPLNFRGGIKSIFGQDLDQVLGF